MENTGKPNFRRLRTLQILAVIAGAVTLVAALFQLDQFTRPDLAPIVISFALAGIAFSAVFYFGCLFFEGSLQKYIVSDDTVIKGETVDMVTTTEESGDAEIDEWVRRYVFARNLFGMSVIPLIIFAWLFWFS